MDQDKTKAELVTELVALCQRVAELETTKAKQKQIEKRLRKSQEELEIVFDNVRDGIVITDMTGKIVRINKRIAKVAGYSEKEIVGKRFGLLKMFPPTSLKNCSPLLPH